MAIIGLGVAICLYRRRRKRERIWTRGRGGADSTESLNRLVGQPGDVSGWEASIPGARGAVGGRLKRDFGATKSHHGMSEVEGQPPQRKLGILFAGDRNGATSRMGVGVRQALRVAPAVVAAGAYTAVDTTFQQGFPPILANHANRPGPRPEEGFREKLRSPELQDSSPPNQSLYVQTTSDPAFMNVTTSPNAASSPASLFSSFFRRARPTRGSPEEFAVLLEKVERLEVALRTARENGNHQGELGMEGYWIYEGRSGVGSDSDRPPTYISEAGSGMTCNGVLLQDAGDVGPMREKEGD